MQSREELLAGTGYGQGQEDKLPLSNVCALFGGPGRGRSTAQEPYSWAGDRQGALPVSQRSRQTPRCCSVSAALSWGSKNTAALAHEPTTQPCQNL